MIDKILRCLLTFTALFILYLSNSLGAQTLTIKIQNKTGNKIDSLIVGTKYIGAIENEGTVGPIQFGTFMFDSGFPYESLFGIVDEKHLHNEWWSWCGTSQSYKDAGAFFFKLIIKSKGDQEYLYLE